MAYVAPSWVVETQRIVVVVAIVVVSVVHLVVRIGNPIVLDCFAAVDKGATVVDF